MLKLLKQSTRNDRFVIHFCVYSFFLLTYMKKDSKILIHILGNFYFIGLASVDNFSNNSCNYPWFSFGSCITGSTIEVIFPKSSCMGDDIYSFLWKLGSLYLSVLTSYIFLANYDFLLAYWPYFWLFLGVVPWDTLHHLICFFCYLHWTLFIHSMLLNFLFFFLKKI